MSEKENDENLNEKNTFVCYILKIKCEIFVFHL